MTTFEFKSLRSWPGPTRLKHEGDQFQCSYSDTIEHLSKEMRAIKVKEAVIKAVFASGSLRKDGLPMENAKMGHPGIIVSFEKPSGYVEIMTDKYADWHSNLRGITLSLEALRGINRWGCAEQEQQYLGFPALPAPDPDILESSEDAARFIARLIDAKSEEALSTSLLESEAMFQIMYPQMMKNLHPDKRNGEGHNEFIKFQKAHDLLRGHYAEGKAT